MHAGSALRDSADRPDRGAAARRFGTNTDGDGTWVNFYTFYHKDGSITAVYEVDTDNSNETFDWELTEVEQAFFRGMMEGYCNHKCGCTLAQLLMEI